MYNVRLPFNTKIFDNEKGVIAKKISFIFTTQQLSDG